MKNDENDVQSNAEWDETARRKLNRGMKRLLTMSEDEIINKIDRDRKRLAESKKQIERMVDVLPPTATKAERETVNKIIRIYQKGLLPHPLFSARGAWPPSPL